MTVTGLGWQEVLEAIKASRPIANPNPGFRQQLEEFGWANSQKVGAVQGRGSLGSSLSFSTYWMGYILCLSPLYTLTLVTNSGSSCLRLPSTGIAPQVTPGLAFQVLIYLFN